MRKDKQSDPMTAFPGPTKDQKLSYAGFLIHGIFLALAVTFTEINTVLPSLIIQSGGAEIHIGILTTIMVGLPLVSQLLFSPFLQTRRRKKPYMLSGIYARMSAFYLIGFLLAFSDRFSSSTVLLLIYTGLILFTLSGAFAGITYVSLIGSTIPRSLRDRFFLNKQVFWSLGIFISGILTRFIITSDGSFNRYSLLFIAAASMLAIASSGFWLIREVPERNNTAVRRVRIFKSMKKILKSDRTFRNYAITSNLLSSSVVMIPFYIKIFIADFNETGSLIGTIVLLQTGGMVLSNLIWPRIVKPLGFKGLLRTQAVMGFVLPLLITSLISLEFGVLSVYITVPFLGALAGANKMAAEAVLVQISPEDSRALYSGIYGAMNLTSALFPLLAAALLTFISWKIFLPVVAFLPLASLVPVAKMKCPVDVRKARETMLRTNPENEFLTDF